MIIQGYAIPWEKAGNTGAGEEIAARDAIDAASGRNITLLWGTHSGQIFAQTRDKTLRFFSDDYGLGFTASIDDERYGARALAAAVGRGEVTECSVNLVDYRHRTDANGRERLIYGAIDHVALVPYGAAAYGDAGCWLAEQAVNDRAPQLRAMSMHFMNSIIEKSRRRSDGRSGINGRAYAFSRPSTPPASRITAPTSLVAMMASEDWRHCVEKQRRGADAFAALNRGQLKSFSAFKRMPSHALAVQQAAMMLVGRY